MCIDAPDLETDAPSMNPVTLLVIALAIFLGFLVFPGHRAQPYPDLQQNRETLSPTVVLSPIVADRLRSRDRMSREEFDKLQAEQARQPLPPNAHQSPGAPAPAAQLLRVVH